jgi:hypothetical protein
MFNPFEYSLSKQNQWTKEESMGQDVPVRSFSQGSPQSLKLTLYFDTSLDGSDVRTHTDRLWKMMRVDEKNKNQSTGKSEPPHVAFKWGRLYFSSVITSMSQKFTLFKPDGTPIRCQVDVTLEEAKDKNKPKDQAPQKGIAGAPKSASAVEGDRLDNLAAKVADEGVGALRRIAEKNGIDNPLNIPPGLKLKI